MTNNPMNRTIRSNRAFSTKQPGSVVLHIFPLILFILGTCGVLTGQTAYRLNPVSGADGVFQTIITSQDTTYKSSGSPGNYQPYMYFKANDAVNAKTVYVEVTFIDNGYGFMGVEYNSTTALYQMVTVRHSSDFLNTGQVKKAVFKLTDADFKKGQNLGADLRLFVSDASIGMQVRSARMYFSPTPYFLAFEEDFVKPYSGKVYSGSDIVDATTMEGKTIVGYQGWFRTAGDPAEQGWIHYVNGGFNDLTVDLWPDMLEFSDAEKYPVPGWKYGNNDQVYLFSSANRKTVLRHFQWMQNYGVDVAAVQRFLVATDPAHSNESFRIAAYAREAANRTGRSYYIMYDMSGYDSNTLASALESDWKHFVDSMQITKDDRYLHHDGKPVVGIYGFYTDRFSPAIAAQVLDVFQNGGKYAAYVAGSGEWWWRTDNAPGWSDIFHRMDAWIPWNVGNTAGQYAASGFWADDKADMEAHGVLYMPLIYPGFAWDNLMNQSPGTTVISRLNGEFLWNQFLDAKNLGAKGVYVAMFDEIDEGTAIFKVGNTIPTGQYFLTLNGLPSDFYLLLTGYGTDIIDNTAEIPDQMPDFTAQTRPSIPFILYPGDMSTIYNPVTLVWEPAAHVSGITEYEVVIDDQLYSTTDVHASMELSHGIHSYKVRAKNGSGNWGGYSELSAFTVGDRPTSVKEPESDGYLAAWSYPNPFRNYTDISYWLPAGSQVEITIIDLNGQVIRKLDSQYQSGGRQTVRWDGTDQTGNRIADGLYVCRIIAGKSLISTKIWYNP
jgi:hypothetical protein